MLSSAVTDATWKWVFSPFGQALLSKRHFISGTRKLCARSPMWLFKKVVLLLLVPGCVVNLNKMKGVVRYKPLF